MSPPPETAINVSHGMPISANAPHRLRRRGGIGSTAAMTSAVTAHHAASRYSVQTSAPSSVEIASVHPSVSGEPIRTANEMSHAVNHAETITVTNHAPNGLTAASNRVGRLSVAWTLDDQRSPPFQTGMNRQTS